MLISQEPSVQFTLNFDSVYMRVCPTTRWHNFCSNDIVGCVWVCEMHPRCIFLAEKAEKQGKIQPGVFLSVSWSVSLGCPFLHNCKPVVFLFTISLLPCDNKVQKKLEFLAQLAATMITWIRCIWNRMLRGTDSSFQLAPSVTIILFVVTTLPC